VNYGVRPVDPELYRFIGRNIAKARELRGYRQVDFGIALGTTQQQVWKWETGLRLPRIETILAMAQLLRMSLDRLLLGESGSESGPQLPRF
jgi:transcriptional regulator with XRE-family HTH domain